LFESCSEVNEIDRAGDSKEKGYRSSDNKCNAEVFSMGRSCDCERDTGMSYDYPDHDNVKQGRVFDVTRHSHTSGTNGTVENKLSLLFESALVDGNGSKFNKTMTMSMAKLG